jgi:hypothetical protein
MESIKNVKLGMNPNTMVVTVSADVTMKGKEDPVLGISLPLLAFVALSQ